MRPAARSAAAERYAFPFSAFAVEREGYLWFEIGGTGMSSAFLQNTKWLTYVVYKPSLSISNSLDEASIKARGSGSTSTIAHC